jgi:uncharacterized membrane protein YccC
VKLWFPNFDPLAVRARLESDWPEAARMVVAAMIAFGVAHLFHMREGYWSVLTTIVTARPQSGGTTLAGRDRLMGTVIGAGLASVFAIARLWHVPEIVLLASTLIPLGLLITVAGSFRTAPIAAVIVLSATPGAGVIHPFGIAIYRSLQIGLGALISTIVSWVVVPSHGENRARDRAATILTRLSDLFAQVLRTGHTTPQRIAELREESRTLLRELGAAARTAGTPRDLDLRRLLRSLANMQADISFLDRVITSLPNQSLLITQHREPLLAATHAFQALSLQTAEALRKKRVNSPSSGELESTLTALEQALDAEIPDTNVSSMKMAAFLFQAIRTDYRDLLALLAGKRR